MKRLSLVALAALVALPLAAQDRKRIGDENDNLHFVVTVSDSSPGGETADHAMETLLLDGQRARLQAGWRIPFPTTTFNAEGESGAKVPVTAISYQDVGVEVSLNARIVEDGRIRASGHVEISSIDPEGPGSENAPGPRVGTFRYAFDVKLESGRATLVAEVPKPAGGSMSLTITGTIQP